MNNGSWKAHLEETAVVALVDTREQNPLDLSPLRTERATLVTGDYTIKGLERQIAIERKSLSDLVGVIGRDRERFEREVQRLLAYPVRALVVESDWTEIEMRQWPAKSRIAPSHVVGSLLGWQALGLPVLMAGNHRRAGKLVARLLYISARRRWREASAFANAIAANIAQAEITPA